MSQVLKALCKAHACSKRDETACKSVVGSTPAAASASAEAEGALTASECRRRAALSQTVMCLPAVESMGAAMPVPWKTYDPTMSDPNAQFPGACCTVSRFAAFPCKHLWTKSCKDMSPHVSALFLQCSWCSFASSEILDQKGGSLSQDDRIPEAPVQNTSSISGATPGRSLTNDKSVFSTLEMMACLQGAKNGGYLDDRQHAETNRAGSLKPITTDTAAGLLTRRAEGTQLLPPD